MKLHIERKFNAAHFLIDATDRERSKSLYGACSSMHGHTWRVVVDLEGPIAKDGMVANFAGVKAIVDKLDHAIVNDFVALPTAENLVLYFLDMLRDRFPILSEITVQVWESDTAYAEDTWTNPRTL